MKNIRRISSVLVAALVLACGLLVGAPSPAQAAWTPWYNQPGQAAFLGCKKAVNSIYGPLWEVQLVAASSPNYSVSGTFQVRRGSQTVQNVKLSARNGAWDVKTTHASRLLGDTFYLSFGVGQISTGYGLGQSLTGPYSFSKMSYC